MITTATSKFKIWRKRMSTQYGYEVIYPMSPSTLEQVAAQSGLEYCHALKKCANEVEV